MTLMVLWQFNNADILQNDEELNLEINSCIKNMTSKKKTRFPCELPDNICLSNSYLKRYVIKKQPSFKVQETSTSDCLGSDLVPIAEMKLGPLTFKGLF